MRLLHAEQEPCNGLRSGDFGLAIRRETHNAELHFGHDCPAESEPREAWVSSR